MKLYNSDELNTRRIIQLNNIQLKLNKFSKYRLKIKKIFNNFVLLFSSRRSYVNVIKNEIHRDLRKDTKVNIEEIDLSNVFDNLSVNFYKVKIRINIGDIEFNSLSKIYAVNFNKVIDISKSEGPRSLNGLKRIISNELYLRNNLDALIFLRLLNELYSECSRFESKYTCKYYIKNNKYIFVINSHQNYSENFLVTVSQKGYIKEIEYLKLKGDRRPRKRFKVTSEYSPT